MMYAVFYAIASHFSVTFTCPFTSIRVFFLSGVINSLFFFLVFKEVADSQMVGAPVIDERKNSTNLTMTFPAQLKPELRTRLAR
jgi:hypothetical protein